MSLEIHKRGKFWHVRGRLESSGEYIRRSLGTSDETVARAKAAQIERDDRRRAILGTDAPDPRNEITFAECVLLYDAKPADAKFLLKVLPPLGKRKVSEITGGEVRQIARNIYPDASADTWLRQVITPVRAVINNAAEQGKCQPIRIKGFTKMEGWQQDQRTGRKSRKPENVGSFDYLLALKDHAKPRPWAAAMLMFVTAARVSQVVAIETKAHLRLDAGEVYIPAAKGHDGVWQKLPAFMIDILREMPKGGERLFGYSSRWTLYTALKRAAARGEMEWIPPHALGRHGFGTEMMVRQKMDEASVKKAGRWSSSRVLQEHYSHGDAGQILTALSTSFAQAEKRQGVKRLKDNNKKQ